MKKLVSNLDEIEDCWRTGNYSVALKGLIQLQKLKLDAPTTLRAAALARRLQNPHLGLMFLRPLISFEKNADPQVMLEHAACLIKEDVISPSLRILERIDKNRFPEALLYQAFSYFSFWDYGSAVPLLKDYLQSPLITEYQGTIGTVNLASALINSGQAQESLPLLENLIVTLKAKNLELLTGNSLELLAQAHIYLKHYPQAETALQEAYETLSKSHPRYLLFVRKWQTHLQSLTKKKDQKEIASEFADLSREAEGLSDFETIRDIELLSSLSAGNADKFHRVYFGTPHEGYRARALRLAPSSFVAVESYHYQLGPRQKSGFWIDWRNHVSSLGEIPLRKNSLATKVLSHLCSDFYRPFSVTRLFHCLFPEDNYDPIKDTHRVYEVIRRTHMALDESQLPLKIVTDKNGYRITSEGCEVVLSRQVANHLGSFDQIVRDRSLSDYFSAKDAQSWTQLSLATVIRKLNAAHISGRLEKAGSGRSTVYKWKG